MLVENPKIVCDQSNSYSRDHAATETGRKAGHAPSRPVARPRARSSPPRRTATQQTGASSDWAPMTRAAARRDLPHMVMVNAHQNRALGPIGCATVTMLFTSMDGFRSVHRRSHRGMEQIGAEFETGRQAKEAAVGLTMFPSATIGRIPVWVEVKRDGWSEKGDFDFMDVDVGELVVVDAKRVESQRRLTLIQKTKEGKTLINCIRMLREMSLSIQGRVKKMKVKGIEVGVHLKQSPGSVIYMKMDEVTDFVMEKGEFVFDVKFSAETYFVADQEFADSVYNGTILPGGMHHGEGVLSTNGNPRLLRYSGEFELERRCGEGCLYNNEGKLCHKGTFRYNVPHGEGVEYTDRICRMGSWEMGTRKGDGWIAKVNENMEIIDGSEIEAWWGRGETRARITTCSARACDRLPSNIRKDGEREHNAKMVYVGEVGEHMEEVFPHGRGLCYYMGCDEYEPFAIYGDFIDSKLHGEGVIVQFDATRFERVMESMLLRSRPDHDLALKMLRNDKRTVVRFTGNFYNGLYDGQCREYEADGITLVEAGTYHRSEPGPELQILWLEVTPMIQRKDFAALKNIIETQPHTTTYGAQTLLHLAAREGWTEGVVELLAAGWNIDEKVPCTNDTAIDLAMRFGHKSTRDALRTHAHRLKAQWAEEVQEGLGPSKKMNGNSTKKSRRNKERAKKARSLRIETSKMREKDREAADAAVLRLISPGKSHTKPKAASAGTEYDIDVIADAVAAVMEKELFGTETARRKYGCEIEPKPEPEPEPEPDPEPEPEPECTSRLNRVAIESIEDHLTCPITSELMKDPVTTTVGNTYEKTAIKAWFRIHNTDPLSNEKLTSKRLIPNNLARSQIQQFLSKGV